MISLTGTNFTLTAKVAAALVECDLDTALSTPASNNTIHTHLA